MLTNLFQKDKLQTGQTESGQISGKGTYIVRLNVIRVKHESNGSCELI